MRVFSAAVCMCHKAANNFASSKRAGLGHSMQTLNLGQPKWRGTHWHHTELRACDRHFPSDYFLGSLRLCMRHRVSVVTAAVDCHTTGERYRTHAKAESLLTRPSLYRGGDFSSWTMSRCYFYVNEPAFCCYKSTIISLEAAFAYPAQPAWLWLLMCLVDFRGLTFSQFSLRLKKMSALRCN